MNSESKKTFIVDRSKMPARQVTTTNLGAFSVVEKVPDMKSIEYASRLYATAREVADFPAALKECMDTRAQPIEAKAPLTAAAELNAWWKAYKRQGNSPATWYNDTIVKTPITVTNVTYAINKTPVPMPGGVPGLAAKDVPYRVAADALMLYTSCSGSGELKITELVNPNAADVIGFPKVNLFSERKSIEGGLRMGDTMIARDAMMTKMQSSVEGTVMACAIQNKVYYQKGLISYTENSANHEFFNKYCNQLGYQPNVEPLRTYKPQSGQTRYCKNITDIWSVYNASGNIRGFNRGRGGLSVGYYRGDLPQHVVVNCNIVSDILFVLKSLNLKTVSLSDVPEIAKILIANGYRVIDPKYGTQMCTNVSKPGIFSAAECSYLHFIMPTLDPISAPPRGEVVLPPPARFPVLHALGNKQKIVHCIRDYIRDGVENQYPSISVADGLCLRLSQDLSLNKKYTYRDLMLRFSRGMAYRNNFIFNRFLFGPMDECRDLFPTFTLPAIKDTKVIDFNGIEQVDVPMDTIPYDCFMTPVPVENARATTPMERVDALYEEYTRRCADWGEAFHKFFYFCTLISWEDYLLVLEDIVQDKEFLGFFKAFDGYVCERFRALLERNGYRWDVQALEAEFGEIFAKWQEAVTQAQENVQPPPDRKSVV